MTTPHTSIEDRATQTAGLALPLMAACVAVYFQGLFGGFLLDDYENIVNNPSLSLVDGSTYRWLAAALSSDSGMLRRPVSMLSFGLNHYLFGMDPIAFKAVNLGVHLLCGLLVYGLSLRLLPFLTPSGAVSGKSLKNHRNLAFFVTALWVLHPLHVSGVMYIVQRMNQLAALFVLAGLYCYASGRLRMLRGESGLLVAVSGLLVFGLLAMFSKENGALILAYAFVIEAICFRFRGPRSGTARDIRVCFVLFLALPILAMAGFIATHFEWLTGGYAARNFTLPERLLTEPRILLHYLYWIFVPLPSLMGLYHDDIPLSTGLLSPPSTVAVLVFFMALVLLAWKTRVRWPGIVFALAWFLAGHAMESTILPLELVFEHRNYLPMAGVLLGTCAAASSYIPVQQDLRVVTALCILMLAGLAGATALRNHSWRSPQTLAMDTARNHPQSPRSLYDAGRAVIFAASNASDKHKLEAKLEARDYFQQAMALDKTYIFPSIGYVLTYFGESEVVDEQTVADLSYRLRNTPLFQATPMLRLLDAIADSEVRMEQNDVQRIFEAAMDNPSANSPQRAMMLNNYGRYHLQVLQDAQSAISLTLAAAEQEPRDPIFQLNLAGLALALKRPDIAAQHVQNAQALDVTGRYREQIADIRTQLNAGQVHGHNPPAH
ncbi:MAG: hypothetical protein AABY95_10070 [Pseudomonadota bacterium]